MTPIEAPAFLSWTSLPAFENMARARSDKTTKSRDAVLTIKSSAKKSSKNSAKAEAASDEAVELITGGEEHDVSLTNCCPDCRLIFNTASSGEGCVGILDSYTSGVKVW